MVNRPGVQTQLDDVGLVEHATGLNIIQQTFTQIDQGTGQLVLVEGAVGSGKSHLVQRAQAEAQALGWRCVVGACQSIDATNPFSVWRQLMRALFGLNPVPASGVRLRLQQQQQIEQVRQQVQRINTEWLERLPLLATLLDLPIPDTVTTAALDVSIRHEALNTLIIDLLQAWSRTQPLLVVLEDIHWLDEASLHLTQAVARAVSRMALVLMLTRQPTHPDAESLNEVRKWNACTELQIAPLSDQAVQHLIAAELQAEPPATLLRLVQPAAQGNPLHVRELVRYLRENQVLRQVDATWECADDVPDVPTSVHNLVRTRIQRLDPDVSRTFQFISVVGQMCNLTVLQRALNTDAYVLQQHLDYLVEHDLLTHLPVLDTTCIHFRHALIQNIVYDDIALDERSHIHQQVADALTRVQPQAVEQLAYHYNRAGQPQRALRYFEQAAERAKRDSAHQTALACYDQLLSLEQRWAWQKQKIELLHLLSQRDQERAALEASETFPDASLADIDWAWGQYYEAISDYNEAEHYLQRARERYRAQNYRPGEMQSIYKLGYIARARGDYDTAKRWYTQGIQTFQRYPPRSTEGKNVHAQLLLGLGTIYRQQGDFPAARSFYMRGLHLYTQQGNQWGKSVVLNSLGGIAYYQRHFAEAQRYYEQALTLQRTIGDRTQEGVSLYNLGLTFQELGDHERAHEYLLAALAIQQATGDRREQSNIWNTLGTLEHQTGDLEGAQRCLARSLEIAQQIGGEALEAYALANIGGVWRDTGDSAQAIQTYLQGLHLAEQQRDQFIISYFWSHLANVYLLDNAPEQAIEYATKALTIRQETGLELWTTTDLATLGAAHVLCGRMQQARHYVEQAIALLQKHAQAGLESPQRDYFVCSIVFQALGEAEAAQNALTRAYDIVMTQAQHLSDPNRRTLFLEALPLNRAIIKAMQELNANEPHTLSVKVLDT